MQARRRRGIAATKTFFPCIRPCVQPSPLPGAPSLRVLQGWGFLDHPYSTFPVVVESKPPPFEMHKGWDTRLRNRLWVRSFGGPTFRSDIRLAQKPAFRP